MCKFTVERTLVLDNQYLPMHNQKEKKHSIIRAVIILGILSFQMIHVVFCQNTREYTRLINEAYTLYQNKEYLKSGNKYTEAFIANGNKGTLYDRYNAACSWALANKPDSAFASYS